jgi:DNA-nicking Smr family endonuclease
MSSSRRRRELTPEELALWQRAMGEAVPDPERAATVPPSPAAPIADATVPKAASARRGAALDPARPVGLDRRSWLRLKRGQVAIELILDLHGQTQEEAHRNLAGFLIRSQAEGRRCVLVVTGKGEPGGGILRHMVPRWLNEGGNRERVVAYTPAQRRHGGAGALYVLLRRHRAVARATPVSADG